MVYFLSRPGEWMILSQLLTSLQLAAWTLFIHSREQMLKVSTMPYVFPSAYTNRLSYVDPLISLSFAGLLHVLDDLENYVRSSKNSIGLRAVQECRVAMEKLIVKMDNLESGFDRIAERSRGLLHLCTNVSLS